MYSYVLIFLCVLLVIFLCLASLTAYQYFYWKIHKVPHPELIPLIGSSEIHLLGEISLTDHALLLHNKVKGVRYFGVLDGWRPAIVIKDANLINEICVENFDNFMDRNNCFIEAMDPVTGRNLGILTGERWKEMRKKLSPIYEPTKIKIMFQQVMVCANKFVKYFIDNQKVAENFNVQNAFMIFSNGVVCSVAFGFEVGFMSDQANELYQNSILAITMPSLLTLLMLKYFPFLMSLFGIRFIRKSAIEYFKSLINQSLITRNCVDLLDMTHSLLKVKNMTVNDIMTHHMHFLSKNLGVSSSVMSFICLELAKDQGMQEKLYREIIENLPNEDDDITYDQLTNLEYLDMILKESLRMYPPVPIILRKCVRKSTFSPSMEGLPNYHMKKGTDIVISVIGFHRNSEYFPEPDKFIPERFADKNKCKINQHAYIPFGLGPRKCLGEHFVMMESKIVLVHILRKFIIKPNANTQYPTKFSIDALYTASKSGISLTFESRKKNN